MIVLYQVEQIRQFEKPHTDRIIYEISQYFPRVSSSCASTERKQEISGGAVDSGIRIHERNVTSSRRPFMGRTYLDVQMGDISLVEVGESFH